MKVTIYTCDENNCNNKKNEKPVDWLMIGSSGNDIQIENNLTDARFKNHGNYRDLHFCSKKCFVDYFISPLTEPPQTKN